ncbi:hypothetical protein KIPB_009600, partial [Kipferlia bialata]
VINYSLACVLALNLCVSLSGSLMFGEDTMPNILSNFPASNILGSLVKVMMLVVMICSFPLVMAINVIGVEEMYGRPMSLKLRSVWVIILTIGCAVVGSLVDSITTVISFMSATSGSIVYFIAPGLMHCYMPRKPPSILSGTDKDSETEAKGEGEREDESETDELNRTSSLLAVVGMLSDVDIVRQRTSLVEAVRVRLESLARPTSFSDMRRISLLATQDRQREREHRARRGRERELSVGMPGKTSVSPDLDTPIRGTETYLGRDRAMTALVLHRADEPERETRSDRVWERSRKRTAEAIAAADKEWERERELEERDREREADDGSEHTPEGDVPFIDMPPPSPMRKMSLTLY